MDLLQVGLSHHTATVDVRAAVAARVGDVRSFLAARSSRRGASIDEVLLLSTCHRFECYVATSNRDGAIAAASEWFGIGHRAFDDPASPWGLREGFDAALHLGRVTAGLDSLIVGEAEIAGQVRKAAALARGLGVFGPYLERVLSGALAASGRARAETKIAEGVRSAASAAVALAASRCGDLSQCNVLVIGAGQTARTVLSRLSRHAARRISVASRSLHHAHAAASIAGASVWSLDEMAERLSDVDVVIAATNASAPLLTAGAFSAAVTIAPQRSKLVVDLSVPRVVDVRAADLPGVELVSVDELGDVANQSAARREREIPLVEAIVRDEAVRAMAKFAERDVWDRTLVSRKP